MSSQNILTLVQKALQTHLRTQTFSLVPSAQIYRGFNRPVLTEEENVEPIRLTPCIECLCSKASPDDPDNNFTGNWVATAEVRVITSSDDTDEDAHHDLCASVYDTLITDTVASDLSAAITGFHTQMVVPGEMQTNIEARNWITSYTLMLTCCPSDLT